MLDSVSDVNFETAEIKWFLDARLNVSKNCIDRHLEKNGEKVAIIWERIIQMKVEKITYNELYKRYANSLMR